MGAGSQRGYLIAALVVAVALMGVFSAVAAQQWADVLRRDNEAEMIFRAQELVRAIQRYRKVRGAPPTKLEQLLEPGPRGEYFLRHQYTDPLVKDGKWGLLHVGPGNTILDPSEEQNAGGLGQEPGRDGAWKPGSEGRSKAQGGSRLENALGEQEGEGVAGGKPRSKLAGQGRPGGEETGLPIAGVKSLCKDKPFRYYNGLDEYRQWLFTYFDLERMQIPGQQNAPGPITPPGGAFGGPGAGRSSGSRGPSRPPGLGQGGGRRPPSGGRQSLPPGGR